MYERKTPIDISCGLHLTMNIIGAKWKPCIIDALREEPKRPSELHKAIDCASPRVLNQQLKELEGHCIIGKKIYPVLPPHSEYYLTELGRSLLPLIDAIDEWGEEHRNFFATLRANNEKEQ